MSEQGVTRKPTCEGALFMEQVVGEDIASGDATTQGALAQEVVEGFALFVDALLLAVTQGVRAKDGAARAVEELGFTVALNPSLSATQTRRVYVLTHETINTIDPYYGYNAARHA